MSRGHLSYEEFLLECSFLAKLCKKVGLTWEVKEEEHVPRRKYMVLKNFSMALNCQGDEEDSFTDAETNLLHDKNVSLEDAEFDEGVFNENVCKDPATGSFVTYEYHIVFNESYGVPTLLFTGYRPDGSSIKLETIWGNVPSVHDHALKERYALISQKEHPYLGYPFYYIHPCHTVELMKNLAGPSNQDKGSSHYLLTWLSAVGPVAGLTLPLSLFNELQ